MGKDDQGLAPHGGILLDDAAAAASGDAVRQRPAASREAEPGIATEGGGAISEASGGRAEPVTGPLAETRPRPVVPPQTAKSPEIAQPSPAPGSRAPEPPAAGSPPAATSDSAPPAAPDESSAHNVPGEREAVSVRAPGVVARPVWGVVARPVTATPEPSLAKVLATTIQLWTSRRLRKIGIGQAPPRVSPTGGLVPGGGRPQPYAHGMAMAARRHRAGGGRPGARRPPAFRRTQQVQLLSRLGGQIRRQRNVVVVRGGHRAK